MSSVREVEGVYIVRKGNDKFVVEVVRTSKGNMALSVYKNVKHILLKKTGKGYEKEDWEHKLDKAKEVSYEELPIEIRKVLAKLLP